MFPSNLHKNIVQLDRQISLLENECKNMGVDKRRKPPYGKCNKISNIHAKASPVKVTLKNSDSSKRNKKLTSPTSGRLQSTSSLPSHSSHSWSGTCEALPGRKTKLSRLHMTVPASSCCKLNDALCNSRMKKCLSCDVCKESSVSDLHKRESVEDDKMLHKELLYSNRGGTIEVTVTQKSNGGKDFTPLRRTANIDDRNQKDYDNCKCQIKGKKWSEILGLDSSKQKAVKENFVKNKFSGDETKTINQLFNCNNKNGYEGNRSQEIISYSNNINNLSIQEENFEVPLKLPSPPYKIKNQPQINSNKLEKEIQCALEITKPKEPLTETKDPLKLIQDLVNQLKQMPINDVKELPDKLETAVPESQTEEPVKPEPTKPEPVKEIQKEMKQTLTFGITSQNNMSLEMMKQQCENLIKEKELLSKELAAKNITIAIMNKREEEYLSLIKSLKLNLERSKENALEGNEALKELNALKSTLLEKIKISESMKINFTKAHEVIERYILENQKLKTEVKILTLEAQKHEVLLAGKEAEIRKYKEEIENFQRQISEHLDVLKSNAQGIDVEKMMQAIFQQSQLFLQTDLESVIVENDQKESSQQNVLMHSSPTSTKTSDVNSSWKQISSIHENDRYNANSEVNLNNDSNAKDYFQIFGENGTSGSKSSKKSKQTLVEILEGKDIKPALSFTSCISVHADQSSSSGSSRSSLISDEQTLSNEEKGVTEVERNNKVSFEQVQSNIDEVLKNMKLKFSKKILETSLANCTIDDLSDFQISSVSQ